MTSWRQIAIVVMTLLLMLAVRTAAVISRPYANGKKRKDDKTCHVAVFLGSGGHTMEMLQLLRALPSDRYQPRIYILADGDQFSKDKAEAAEREANENGRKEIGKPLYRFVELPRARHVHQAWLTTPASTVLAFIFCVYYIVWQPFIRQTNMARSSSYPSLFADLIIMNGPGTCVPIVAAVLVQRILGLSSPRLVYVESFARVQKLSLTGKILQYFVDRFIVQWKQAERSGREYVGWLI